MIFISVHTPKTAGTSLAHVFDHGTDRAVLYDYRSDYTNFMFSAEEEAQFVRARDYVLWKFRFIHGHFCLLKYRSILPEAHTVTCFRDPVARTISQYKHIWYEANEKSSVYQQFKAGMDVVAFSERRNIANAQSIHLGCVAPKEIDFIFMDQALDEGLRLFRLKYPGVLVNRWANLPVLNTGVNREKWSRKDALVFSDAQLSELAILHKDEIDYCRQATEAYHRQKADILKSTISDNLRASA